MSVTRLMRSGGIYTSINKYAKIPDSQSLHITDKITMGAWILFLGANGRTQDVMRKGESYILGWISHDISYIASYIYGTTWHCNNYSKSPSWFMNSWHHIMMDYDGSVMRNYIDGELDTTLRISTKIRISTYSLGLGWGSEECPREFFNGCIFEPFIYNRILTSDERKNIVKYGIYPKDGLVMLLPMTEYEGDIIHDISGNNNNATIYGAEWVIKKAKRLLSI